MKIKIYTDGACSGNPGPGGYAACLIFPSGAVKEICGYESETTNNRMELLAIIAGLERAFKIEPETKLQHLSIDIYSDSAYVVNAVNNSWYKKWAHCGWKTVKDQDVKNRDLWERLIELFKNRAKISFIKVKGHNGNPGNERADVLARNAIAKHRS